LTCHSYSISEIRKKVISSTINSLNDSNNILNDVIRKKSVQLLHKSKKILFYGAGASSNISKSASLINTLDMLCENL